MTNKEFYIDKKKYFENELHKLSLDMCWALEDLLSSLSPSQRALLNGYRINDLYQIADISIKGDIYVQLDDYDDNIVQLQSMTINEMLSLFSYIVLNILK